MSQIDLRLAGGSVLLPEIGLRKADILVSNGRIAAVIEPGDDASATESVLVTGLTILPGAVDAHVHLGHGSDISRPRLPSDAVSETAAAAIGVVTCIIP